MLLKSVSKWEFVRGNPNRLFILVLGDELLFLNMMNFCCRKPLKEPKWCFFWLTKVGDMAKADGFLSDIRQVYYSECRLSSVRELRCFWRFWGPLSRPLGPRAPVVLKFFRQRSNCSEEIL